MYLMDAAACRIRPCHRAPTSGVYDREVRQGREVVILLAGAALRAGVEGQSEIR